MKSPHLLLVGAVAFTCNAQEAPDVVTERTTAVPAWALTLVEIERCRPESDACDTELYVEGPKRKRRLLGSGLTGPFVPLLKAKNVFSCESNEVMGTKGPVLMGLNGKKALLPPHPGY